MTKLFKNFPPELEQYNPDISIAEIEGLKETFDENGLHHSYNDEPSKVERKYYDLVSFQWHSHGKLYRENGKPFLIAATNSTYYTGDENDNGHSYSDMPSMILVEDNYINLEWQSHGESHRDEDLPADITWSIDYDTQEAYCDIEKYYTNGVKTRANNLPTDVGNDFMAWRVNGEFHNLTGYALQSTTHDTGEKAYQWFLYGIRVTEEDFNEIISYAKSTKVPVWVSFLATLNVVTIDNINIFKDEEDESSSNIPLQWVLKSWGINAKVFSLNLLDLHEKNNEVKKFYPDKEKAILESFISIASLEE